MNSSRCKPIPCRATLVTQPGVTVSQPGVSVSTTSPIYTADGTCVPGVCRLNVSRHYDHIPNEFGGHGVSKPCDADGMLFISTEEARAYALARGYLQVFRFPEGHQRRIETERKHPGVYNPRLRGTITGGIDSDSRL